MRRRKIDAYIAGGREKHGMKNAPPPRGRIPQGLTSRERMRRKVRTLNGRRTYARCKAIVGPAIGQIKHALGFRQFSLKGYQKTRAEWFLVSAAHYLRKLFTAFLRSPKGRELMAT